MNLLYISSKKRWGGVSSWMNKTALGLQRRGHIIWIIAHPHGHFIKAADPKINLVKKKLGMDYNPLMVYFLTRFIKSRQIDLVVTNIEKEVIIGGIAARLCKIPNIRRVGREDDFNEKFKVKWHHKVLVNHSIVPCSLVRDNAVKRASWLDKNQFTIIYNGKNCVQYSKAEIAQKRKQWGLSGTDVIIGVTSQLARVKGIDSLIKVFGKINQNYPKTRLVISGAGREKENLQSLVKAQNLSSQVVFAGFTKNPLLSAAAYDIAVSNSTFEGFPNTVVEYFAASKPVITTNAGGVAEMVKHHENALLIDCKDEAGLYKNMEILLTNPEFAKKLGKNAAQTIKQGFSEDIMIAKLEDLFIREIKKHNKYNTKC